MQDYEKPVWGFTHNNGEGAISTKSFHLEDDTWTGALQGFIYFLRGLGYNISDDSVAINSERHMTGEEWQGGYYTPEGDSADCDTWIDWDDCYCDRQEEFNPPFEGEPEECAFESEPVVSSLEDFLRAIAKQKGE